MRNTGEINIRLTRRSSFDNTVPIGPNDRMVMRKMRYFPSFMVAGTIAVFLFILCLMPGHCNEEIVTEDQLEGRLSMFSQSLFNYSYYQSRLELENSYHADAGRRGVVVINIESDLKGASSNYWAVVSKIQGDVIEIPEVDVIKFVTRQIEVSSAIELVGIIKYVQMVVPGILPNVKKSVFDISKISEERQPVWRRPIVHSWMHTQVIIPSSRDGGEKVEWTKSSALDWLSRVTE